MKHMKRAAALFLALIMIMSLAVTAYAATTPTGKITIKSSATVKVANKTFNAYKILDATMKDPADPSKGVSYYIPAELSEVYATKYSLDTSAADFRDQVVVKITEDMTSDPQSFAKDMLAKAKAARIAPKSATAGDKAESVAIEDMPLGYYIVEDAGAATPISALMVHTPNNSTQGVEITLKADQNTLDKKIDGEKDKDSSTSGSVPANSAAIGDNVPFILTSKVPDITDYKKYFFIVNDTMSKGLTFNNDVAIKIKDTTVDPANYAVSSATAADTGITTIKIVMKDFLNYLKTELEKENDAKFAVGDSITITYSATVNQQADLGETPNTNSAKLTYSHHPEVIPKGENEPNDEDKENNVTGETPATETKTYVTGLEITKVDSNSKKPLAGAEFELTGTNTNTTTLVKTGKFVEDADGTYYKLNDGTYTETAPGEGTNDQYESTETKYKKEVTSTPTTNSGEDVHIKGTTGPDGILRFDGLMAGKYTITELTAPDGYNKLTTPTEVTITCTPGNDPVWTVSTNAGISNGIATITVENTAGSVLPETGGMGTTIFYVMGSMLVLASAALLVADKRRKMF